MNGHHDALPLACDAPGVDRAGAGSDVIRIDDVMVTAARVAGRVSPFPGMVRLPVDDKNRRAGFASRDQAKALHSPRLLLIHAE